MKNAKQYFENTKNNPPRPLTKKIIEMNTQIGNAVELGCGAGSDTVYLIKNGWNVTAIDMEDTEKIIREKLNNEQSEKLKFSRQSFEELELEENNLIVANFSLPFCDENQFSELWRKIANSILKEGYFVGNFFGIKDSWVKTKSKMTFLTKEQVLKLFEDYFEIVVFKEIEYDKETALGNVKHWHLFNVIAKKK